MTIEIPEEQLQAMLDTLDASRREMTGTARLLGRQHEAIVGMASALSAIIGCCDHADALAFQVSADQETIPAISVLAQRALNLWGGV